MSSARWRMLTSMTEATEYLPAVYLLNMSHLDTDVVRKYVHDRWIDFDGLLAARGWSTTEELVIRAAQSIWSGKRECGIGEACLERLSDHHFRTILEAMAMRRNMQITFLPTTEEPAQTS